MCPVPSHADVLRLVTRSSPFFPTYISLRVAAGIPRLVSFSKIDQWGEHGNNMACSFEQYIKINGIA